MNTAMLGTYWECWILIVAAPVGDALGRLRTKSAAWPSRRTCNKRHSAQWPPSKRCSQRPGRRPAGILPPREHAESTEHWSHLELTLVMHSLVECALRWVGFAVKDPAVDQKRKEHAGSTGQRGTWRSQPGKDDNTGLFFCRAAYNAQWIKQWSRSYVQHDDRCQHNYQK